MIKNFIRISFRSFLRDKYFTVINVVGLSIGLACSILVYSYVQQQLDYDVTHPDAGRLYRVNQTNVWSPEGGIMSSTALPLAHVLESEFPEVEESVRINTPGSQIVRYDNGREVMAYYEEKILGADDNFFSFFDFTLAAGDPATALNEKNKVVLSPEMASKLFGHQPALGKTLHLGDERIPVEVTGVTHPQKANMHFGFDLLISIKTNPNIEEFEWSWIWTQVVTYCRLKDGASPEVIEAKFEDMADRHVAPTFARFGMDYNDFIAGKGGWNFYLQPVKDIHLYSMEIGNRIGPVGNVRYVYVFGFVGVFVLLLAVINFINLATATSASRAKEIGVKKVLGVSRASLVLQFQAEALLLSLAAALIGLGVMEVLRIYITQGLGIELPALSLTRGWPLLILLPIGVGIAAGIYPALYLTSFKPVSILKGKLSSGLRRSGLRNSLVIMQFAISLGFISATLIVHQQLSYFRDANLGFDQENLLVINHAEKTGDQIQSMRDEASNLGGVSSVSLSMDVPGRGAWEDIFMAEGREEKYPLSVMKIDENFLSTLDIDVIEGGNFEKGNAADRNAVILNEISARLMGWTPEQAIGKKINYLGDDVGSQIVKGVVRDFHFQSLRENIAPIIFFHVDSPIPINQRVMAVRFETEDLASVLASLKELWSKRTNDAPFEYSFLKEEWTRKYQTEEKLGGLFGLFTMLSIVIAMIGLVGLVAYAAENRRKEIGVRKVMGASVAQVVLMLNGSFTRLMLISFLIAVPASWYAMNKWLDQFPYKESPGFSVFAVAGVVLLGITWLTVSYQSLKAALTNPTDVLKEE